MSGPKTTTRAAGCGHVARCRRSIFRLETLCLHPTPFAVAVQTDRLEFGQLVTNGVALTDISQPPAGERPPQSTTLQIVQLRELLDAGLPPRIHLLLCCNRLVGGIGHVSRGRGGAARGDCEYVETKLCGLPSDLAGQPVEAVAVRLVVRVAQAECVRFHTLPGLGMTRVGGVELWAFVPSSSSLHGPTPSPTCSVDNRSV